MAHQIPCVRQKQNKPNKLRQLPTGTQTPIIAKKSAHKKQTAKRALPLQNQNKVQVAELSPPAVRLPAIQLPHTPNITMPVAKIVKQNANTARASAATPKSSKQPNTTRIAREAQAAAIPAACNIPATHVNGNEKNKSATHILRRILYK